MEWLIKTSISTTINLSIGVFDIPYDSMHGLGTPKDLDFYLDQQKESYEKI